MEDTNRKEDTSPNRSENVTMEDIGSSPGEARLPTVDENVAMQDAVELGAAAAQSLEAAADRKRELEHEFETPQVRQKFKTDDGYITEASMKSSATVPRGNRGPDQQQLDYRECEEDPSVASMNDDASLTSRNTWKSMASILSHQQQLSQRREKDKEKYSSMSKEERKAYNAKRRDKYHRQSQEARQKQRQRARNRYHHISGKESIISEAESQARKERRDKLQQERIRSKQAITTAATASTDS